MSCWIRGLQPVNLPSHYLIIFTLDPISVQLSEALMVLRGLSLILHILTSHTSQTLPHGANIACP